jgi:acyl-CoA thioester hydrolase
MGEPAWFRLKVRHYEVDGYGHVNHATYVHYLETARLEALEGLGLSLEEMRRQGYRIVAADLAVRFHAPTRSGDTLVIRTRIRQFQGPRSIWTQEIFQVEGQRLLVSAEVTGVFTTEDGRPVRIPPAFRDKLMTLFFPADSTGGEGEPVRTGQRKGVRTRKGGGGYGAENS